MCRVVGLIEPDGNLAVMREHAGRGEEHTGNPAGNAGGLSEEHTPATRSWETFEGALSRNFASKDPPAGRTWTSLVRSEQGVYA